MDQNDARFVFKDESKEILGVIIDKQSSFSGIITIEYNLKLPALINGLGYEHGNYYLRNFTPNLPNMKTKYGKPISTGNLWMNVGIIPMCC